MSRSNSPSKLHSLVTQVRDLDHDLAAQENVREQRSGMLSQFSQEVDRLEAKNREMTTHAKKLESRMADEHYKSVRTAEREEKDFRKVQKETTRRIEQMNSQMLDMVKEERKQRETAEDTVAQALNLLLERFRVQVDLVPPVCTTFETADNSTQALPESRSLNEVGLNEVTQTTSKPATPSRTVPLCDWKDMSASRKSSKSSAYELNDEHMAELHIAEQS